MAADDLPELLGQYIPLHYHGFMLSQSARLEAFREAIERLVQPGSHVLDLGGGTGVLSFFAARRGGHVTCVERNPPVAAAARELLALNGVSEAVAVVEADAATYVPDRPVDVLVCEMLHSALVREKQVPVIAGLKRRHQERFGKPIGLFIPEATLLAAQPVHHAFTFHGYRAPLAMFYEPTMAGDPTVELGPPLLYSTVEYRGALPERLALDAEATVEAPGRLNALRFVTKNIVGIFPAERRAAEWHSQYMVLPLAEALEVAPGDRVRVRFDYAPGASIESLRAGLDVTRG